MKIYLRIYYSKTLSSGRNHSAIWILRTYWSILRCINWQLVIFFAGNHLYTILQRTHDIIPNVLQSFLQPKYTWFVKCFSLNRWKINKAEKIWFLHWYKIPYTMNFARQTDNFYFTNQTLAPNFCNLNMFISFIYWFNLVNFGCAVIAIVNSTIERFKKLHSINFVSLTENFQSNCMPNKEMICQIRPTYLFHNSVFSLSNLQ